MADTFTPDEVRQILDAFFDTVGSVQYVGARVVPIFGRPDEPSWDWDNSAGYESLTVVTYQGNSFISRRDVPAGVDINNTSYWLPTGNFNAQIEAYRQEVRRYDGRITAVEDDIERLDGIVDGLAENIEELAALDDRVDTLETDMGTMSDTVSGLGDDISGLDERLDTAEGNISTNADNVSALDGRLDTAESNISGLTDDVGALDTRLDTAEGNISTNADNITALGGRLTTAEGDIDNLEAYFSDWPEETPTLTVKNAFDEFSAEVSDSFHSVWNAIGQSGTAWENANVLCVLDSFGNETGTYGVTKCWAHQVCDAMGANYVPITADGCGFVNDYGTGKNLVQRFNEWIADDDNDPESINYIIVSAGVNDYDATGTQLYNAMVSFMDIATLNFPNAIIFMVPQIAGANIEKCYVASSTKNQWTFPATTMQMVYASNNYPRAVLITNVQYCLNMRTDNVMNADYVHPTQRGHNVIARTFINSLYGNDEISTYTTTDLYISLNANGTKYALSNSAATIIKHPTFYEIGITLYTTNAYTSASDVPYVWIKNIVPSVTPEAFGTCFIYSASTSSTHVGYCDPHVDYKTYTANQSEDGLLGIGFNVGDRSALVGSTGFISTAHLTIPMVHGFVENV